MASLATAVALVGVGVVLVRRPRERREARGDERRGRPHDTPRSLVVDEPSAPGLQRVIIGQLDLAIGLLEAYPGESGEHTVHETRKALKRARALVRLLRDELDDKRFARVNAKLRDCARQLAGARDAAVMLAALDGLLERHPELAGASPATAGGSPWAASRVDGASTVRSLRAELVAERDSARIPAEVPRQVAAELWMVRAGVATRDLSGRRRASSKLLAGGLESRYRQGRRRMRRARRHERDVATMHAWRKSAKDLRYVAETLERAGARRPRKPMRRLRRVARRADRLGEMLGEEHDLALLALRVGAHAKRRGLGKRAHRDLSRAIERRRKRLRKRALREGERLYGSGPQRFVRRVRGAL